MKSTLKYCVGLLPAVAVACHCLLSRCRLVRERVGIAAPGPRRHRFTHKRESCGSPGVASLSGLTAVWRKVSARLRWSLVALLLAGCINTPLPDYYVLTPENGQIDLRDKMPGIAVGIGPITIPETLNRSNIVTPRDSNQLVVAEYHRWSEPLRDNISRILITNLAARTALDKLYAYPWLGNDVDYQLRLDVLQMTGTLQDSVYLQVRWQVLTGTKPATIIRTRIRDYRQTVGKNSYSSMVAAYSRTFAMLSDDISTDLAEISRQ